MILILRGVTFNFGESNIVSPNVFFVVIETLTKDPDLSKFVQTIIAPTIKDS